MNHDPQIFPVALLLDGRHCLIIGGGKVATHKAELLLETQAQVTVVSPELSAPLRALADEGRLHWRKRRFQPSDLDGVFLVYAATGEARVNREALTHCRQRNILCCSVDANWPESDFLTPASLRDRELTIAISTAGHACRRARLIRQSIQRHVRLVSEAQLLIIGTSHEQLPIEARERLQTVGREIEACGDRIFRIWGVHEFMLVSTCNRLELHAIGVPDPVCLDMICKLLRLDQLPHGSFYIKRGFEAFQHSCTLCAGLLSQMPCEYHIVAQLKAALKLAADHGWSAAMMQDWLSAVLHISAEVRQHYDENNPIREIEDLAIDYLHQQYGKGKGQKLLLLGTGVMGRSILGKLNAEREFDAITWCWNRTPPTLPVSHKNFTVSDLDALPALLPQADVIIAALSTAHPLLTPASFTSPLQHPLHIIDLGMPRNASPDLPAHDRHITLTDLDSLKSWHRREHTDLQRCLDICNRLVNQHRDYYEKLVSSFQGRHPQQ